MIALWAIYKNVPFQVNPAVEIFGQPLENFGLLFIPTSGHTAGDRLRLALFVLKNYFSKFPFEDDEVALRRFYPFCAAKIPPLSVLKSFLLDWYCGQSYKASIIINFESRVVLTMVGVRL